MIEIFFYIKQLFFSFVLGLILTKIIISLSRKYGLFDRIGERKIHKREISRLGGVGVITAFFCAIFISGSLVFDSLKIGMIICSGLILIFGMLDDFKNLSWKKQIIFQIFLAVVMIAVGLRVDYIANPFGGSEFRLDSLALYGLPILGSFFIVVWVVGFINAVNWLDGMDGLASGVGAIAAFTLFFLSISDLVNQPPLAIMAISLAGALLGFLVFNFYPARIFLGSSGSWFLGFMLSVLAIFAGGKIATVFLVMGFPILDALWVIIKRVKDGRSPFEGDKSHFHHNLLDLGWRQREVALFIYLICGIFGLSAILFQGMQKFVALLALFVLVSFLAGKLKFNGQK